MSGKHPPSGHTPTTLPVDDLECDPGIGRSAGSTASSVSKRELREAADLEDGESTFEGDVANDATPDGGRRPGPAWPQPLTGSGERPEPGAASAPDPRCARGRTGCAGLDASPIRP